MRLKITEVSFTNENNWIFKLTDGISDYYILDDEGYKSKGLESPITKYELDYWDIGHSILCEADEYDELKVVIRLR